MGYLALAFFTEKAKSDASCKFPVYLFNHEKSTQPCLSSIVEKGQSSFTTFFTVKTVPVCYVTTDTSLSIYLMQNCFTFSV